MTTSIDLVNRALEQIGAQTQIAALNDGTAAGNAAGVIYNEIVQMVLRALNPDFSRTTITLIKTPNIVIPPPYAFEYFYPADCLRIREVRPAVGAYDQLDPQPVRKAVATDKQVKVILTHLAAAQLVYTTSSVTENALTSETIVRHLAHPLSMAVSGRPDFAKAMLEEAMQVAAMAEQHDDGV
jgi:hypothetical protein